LWRSQVAFYGGHGAGIAVSNCISSRRLFFRRCGSRSGIHYRALFIGGRAVPDWRRVLLFRPDAGGAGGVADVFAMARPRAMEWRAEEYISFVCKFMLGMGLGFELPVVI